MKRIESLEIGTNYLRDMSHYPLKSEEEGEFTNRQESKCNNFNHRKDDGVPIYVMQHHTVSDFDRTVQTFTKETVSAHYVIAKDGVVEKFVDPYYRAYHAGFGKLQENSKLDSGILKGRSDMNSWSIGIENVNNGKELFTKEQIEANLQLCQSLSDNNTLLRPELMLAHSDWAPGKKIDVSPYFPWQEFADAKRQYEDSDLTITKNFGIYPRKDKLDLEKEPEVVLSFEKCQKEKNLKENIITCQNLLRKYGYFIPKEETGIFGDNTQNAILSYKIHFDGPNIIAAKLKAWDGLWENSSDPSSKAALAQWNENDISCLGDVIAQF